MRRMLLKILAIAWLMNVAAYGQSLGDVARENREKQNAEAASGTQPKVITNQDLPRDPGGDSGQREAAPGVSTTASLGSADYHSAEQRLAEQHASEHWKRQILTQEGRIADLQARINQMNASIHPPGSVQYEGWSGRYRARQMQHVAELQARLDEQKRRLDLMQEEARHAGMHTQVYDP